MQAAVAAGLCGLGSVFVGSMEGVAKTAVASTERRQGDHRRESSASRASATDLHKPIDPRTVRLFEIARETGFYGKYCALMEEIGKEKGMALNATGAIGALACELGLDWRAVRGIGVMARAVGLVGHLLEESRQPMAEEIWHQVEEEATRHIDKT